MLMVETKTSGWNRRFRWFLAISLLLHMIFFAGYGAYTHFELFPTPDQPQQEENPIVFEVVESPNPPEEQPPEKARYASDRNTRAANPVRTPERGDLPFQVGDMAEPVPERMVPPQSQPSPAAPAQQPAESQSEMEEPAEQSQLGYLPPSPTFSRDALLGRASAPAVRPERRVPALDNRKFSVDDLGGFAFNTYDWNFAPYLLYLKKRIEKNIFPPPAFTRMGIIEGRAVVRFVIAKDGKLLSLQVLQSEGHHSLTETSVNAVEVSAPFRPLPSDFPEDVLEVTGTFIYKVYR